MYLPCMLAIQMADDRQPSVEGTGVHEIGARSGVAGVCVSLFHLLQGSCMLGFDLDQSGTNGDVADTRCGNRLQGDVCENVTMSADLYYSR